MKIVNVVEYVDDQAKVAAIRPKHREYMEQLRSSGQLIAGGQFLDGSGALFIYETASIQSARAIFAADPYSTGRVIAHNELKEWQLVKATPELLVVD